jgi:hypothetical protein
MVGRGQAAQLEIHELLRSLLLPSSPACLHAHVANQQEAAMIRKLASGEYRLYSRKLDPKTHKRRNLGTFKTREKAEKHEREVQYFKRH